ncbi:MAG TPA: cell division protein ZapB [Desulfomonilia bacterium]
MEILDTLEEKINQLLQTVEALKKENLRLTEKLIEKEEEANGLSSQVEMLLAEKEKVKEKVEHLIKSVETF